MRVKKYVVNKMPEALVLIRKELGNDAVILDQKKIKVGGFLGLFRKTKLEVTAAIETSPRKVVSTITPPKAAVFDHANGDVRKDNGEFLTSASYNEDKMAEEIKELKSMFIKMMCNSGKEDFPENLQRIYHHLMKNDVDEEVINHLMSVIIGKIGSPRNIDDSYLYEMVENEIAKMIEKSIKVVPKTEKQQIFAFVGPTGVGKTTTIAKLAAYYILEKKMSVGFITADTYRIAAVEQLRTYATILNIPIEIVISHDDMQRSIQNLRDRDIILIDTAGRNYRSGTNVAELKSLLKVAAPDETYLVLSLTTKQSDLHEITSCFNDMKVDNFIFTKADETSSFGTVLNMLHEHKKTLSIITNGQNVPEDIMFVDPQKLASLIVGDRHA